MPTVKFTSFEAAADDLLLRPRAASIAARMRSLFALTGRISPLRHQEGIRKFRSIEEAAADRDKGSERPALSAAATASDDVAAT